MSDSTSELSVVESDVLKAGEMGTNVDLSGFDKGQIVITGRVAQVWLHKL